MHSHYSDSFALRSGNVQITYHPTDSGYLLSGPGVVSDLFPTLELAKQAAEHPAPDLQWTFSEGQATVFPVEPESIPFVLGNRSPDFKPEDDQEHPYFPKLRAGGELPRLPGEAGARSVSFVIEVVPAGRMSRHEEYVVLAAGAEDDFFDSLEKAKSYAQGLFEKAYRRAVVGASPPESAVKRNSTPADLRIKGWQPMSNGPQTAWLGTDGLLDYRIAQTDEGFDVFSGRSAHSPMIATHVQSFEAAKLEAEKLAELVGNSDLSVEAA